MAVTSEAKIICETLDFAAYLDGEMDAAAQESCEAHVAECSACAAVMRDQRALGCELNFVFGAQVAEMPLPVNFTELVTVRAQASLGGVRTRREHAKALRLCAWLGLAALVLCGGAWREMLWQPVRQLCTLGATLIDFAAHALYQAGVGLAVVTRTLGGHLLSKSLIFNLLAIILWLAACVFLTRLISRYHRSHPLN